MRRNYKVNPLEAGVTVVVGHLYGRGDRDRVQTLLRSLPLTAALLGTGLTLLVLCLSDPILRLLNCPAESIYLSFPICWGLCTVLSMIAFAWLFRRRAGVRNEGSQ